MANDEKLTTMIPWEMCTALDDISEKTGNPVATIVRTAIAKELMEWEARKATKYISYERPWWMGYGGDTPCGGLDG